MKRLIYILLLISTSLTAQNTYYCQDTSENANASDANAGTDISLPWATWQHAFTTADAGDTVYFREGTWYPDDFVSGTNNVIYVDPYGVVTRVAGNDGEDTAWIHFFNYPGETPIFDCSQVDTVGHDYNTALGVNACNYFHLKGLTIQNIYQTVSGQAAGAVGGYGCSNFIFENMTIRDAGGRGTYWNAGFGGPIARSTPADTVKWINCDFYNCADPYSEDPYNAGDGLKADNEIGAYFLIQGCRFWNCSDDACDPSGTWVGVIDNSWFFNNGWYIEGGSVIDGNGLKTGAVRDSVPYVTRVVHHCVAAFNSRSGLYDYGHGNIVDNVYRTNGRYYNNIAWGNLWGLYGPSYDDSWRGSFNLTQYYNNISHNNENDVVIYTWFTESNNTFRSIGPSTWDQPNPAFTVTNDDFIYTDSATIVSMLLAPRNADGSLPPNPFQLAEGSDLIDGGTTVIDGIDTIKNVGAVSYNGSAPDLGPWESNYNAKLLRLNSSGDMQFNGSGAPLYFREE